MGDVKRAFLVWGPESSGTRLLTKILIAAGCEGDDGHRQRWDDEPPTDQPLIVWRRSWPHGPHKGLNACQVEWPDESDWQLPGYEITVLMLTRHPAALAHSQVARNHVADADEAREMIEAAYMQMGVAAHRLSCRLYVVPYESLAKEGATRLCWYLGLKDPGAWPIQNRNFKTINPGMDAATILT